MSTPTAHRYAGIAWDLRESCHLATACAQAQGKGAYLIGHVVGVDGVLCEVVLVLLLARPVVIALLPLRNASCRQHTPEHGRHQRAQPAEHKRST